MRFAAPSKSRDYCPSRPMQLHIVGRSARAILRRTAPSTAVVGLADGLGVRWETLTLAHGLPLLVRRDDSPLRDRRESPNGNVDASPQVELHGDAKKATVGRGQLVCRKERLIKRLYWNAFRLKASPDRWRVIDLECQNRSVSAF